MPGSIDGRRKGSACACECVLQPEVAHANATVSSIKLRHPACFACQCSACTAVASRARHTVLLTGTPSLAKPYDLYRQVCVLPSMRGVQFHMFSISKWGSSALVVCKKTLSPSSFHFTQTWCQDKGTLEHVEACAHMECLRASDHDAISRILRTTRSHSIVSR